MSDPTKGGRRVKDPQTLRVYLALKRGPVCGTTFGAWGIPRYAARVYELRQMGFDVASSVCRLHEHATRQTVYTLTPKAEVASGPPTPTDPDAGEPGGLLESHRRSSSV